MLRTFRTAISPLTNAELLCKLGREKSPAQRWARRGESRVFSLLGTFLRPAKINTRLLTELLSSPASARNTPVIKWLPRDGAGGTPEVGRVSCGAGFAFGMLSMPVVQKHPRFPIPLPSYPRSDTLRETSNILATAKFEQGKHFAGERENKRKPHKKLVFCFATSLDFYI